MSQKFSFAAFRFQENLIKTMMQIESTFFDLAASCSQNCLVICDRGTMDASACTYSYCFLTCSYLTFKLSNKSEFKIELVRS